MYKAKLIGAWNNMRCWRHCMTRNKVIRLTILVCQSYAETILWPIQKIASLVIPCEVTNRLLNLLKRFCRLWRVNVFTTAIPNAVTSARDKGNRLIVRKWRWWKLRCFWICQALGLARFYNIFVNVRLITIVTRINKRVAAFSEIRLIVIPLSVTRIDAIRNNALF